MLEFTLRGFIYAIVNFLLLVALLYKFMHKPLLNMLESRREKIRSRKEEAEKAHREAQELKEEYQANLASIEEERSNLLSEAKTQTEDQREKILTEARESARKEVEEARRDWERRRKDAVEELRQDIVSTAAELAGAILQKVTGNDVEKALCEMVLEELKNLAQADEHDRRELVAKDTPVRVVSTGGLDQETRDRLVNAVRDISGQDASVDFEENPDLVGGLKVEFVSRAIDGSIQGMLDDVLRKLSERQGRQNGEQDAQDDGQEDSPENEDGPEAEGNGGTEGGNSGPDADNRNSRQHSGRNQAQGKDDDKGKGEPS